VSPVPVLLALGSNAGDRKRFLRAAVEGIRELMAVVRISSLFETAPIDAPSGSPDFLNLVVAGHTALRAEVLLDRLHQVEARSGRRRGLLNAPRTIDIDLILYGAILSDRNPRLPHPRFARREFVLAPLRELELTWVDPRSGESVMALRGQGAVRRVGTLY
jgi:2-amino-4-hydroxy-6-hydroxymethyldihydropteridine diphosphokinase